jgi:hypothetical protein
MKFSIIIFLSLLVFNLKAQKNDKLGWEIHKKYELTHINKYQTYYKNKFKAPYIETEKALVEVFDSTSDNIFLKLTYLDGFKVLCRRQNGNYDSVLYQQDLTIYYTINRYDLNIKINNDYQLNETYKYGLNIYNHHFQKVDSIEKQKNKKYYELIDSIYGKQDELQNTIDHFESIYNEFKEIEYKYLDVLIFPFVNKNIKAEEIQYYTKIKSYIPDTVITYQSKVIDFQREKISVGQLHYSKLNLKRYYPQPEDWFQKTLTTSRESLFKYDSKYDDFFTYEFDLTTLFLKEYNFQNRNSIGNKVLPYEQYQKETIQLKRLD